MYEEYQKRLGIIAEEVDALRKVDSTALTNNDRAASIRTLEILHNQLRALQHPLIQQIFERPGKVDSPYTRPADIIVGLTRCSRHDARRRIARADTLSARTTLAGQHIDPPYPLLSAAVDDGAANAEHLAVIDEFDRYLKTEESVDPDDLTAGIDHLGHLTRTLSPESLRIAARHLTEWLLPDGKRDKDASRGRSITLSPQRENGLSRLRGDIDAEMRALLEPLLAKFAAPGMLDPESGSPLTEPEPDTDTEPADPISDERRRSAAARDTRSASTRRHDAAKFALRTALMSQTLGTHRGLPVTVVVTMTIQQLEAAAGYVRTGGGTRLTIADAIRLATHSHHYLAIFDEHTRQPLYLARTKRTASPDQRLVLHALDHGCSFPECTSTAYYCEAHHRIDDWADGGLTDADALTFACPKHHRLHGTEPDQYRTSVAPPGHPRAGRTLWHHNTTDPDMTKGRVNHAHHPEEYFDH